MICGSCQTNLPDEAVACWKCGSPVSTKPSAVPKHVSAKPEAISNAEALGKPQIKRGNGDPLFIVLTLLITVALFICVGWAIPFTVWGSLIAYSKQFPQWSGIIDTLSGILFYVSAIGVFVGTWWGSYQVLRRLTAKPSV